MQDWTPETLQTKLDEGQAVFLKLWKRGCGACKLSKPAIERIAEKDAAGLVFGQINVDDHPEMLDIADTEVLPVFFIFKDKKMLGKHIGFKGLAKLQGFYEEALQGQGQAAPLS